MNTKSGGKQGIKLLSGFKRHLNPHQVYDLLNGGPIPGSVGHLTKFLITINLISLSGSYHTHRMYAFCNVAKYRVLVAGGDGTVGWVLGALDDMMPYLKEPHPPCGVLPLGTGNDLARALKCGGGYSGEKVMQILYSLEDSNVVDFDRFVESVYSPLFVYQCLFTCLLYTGGQLTFVIQQIPLFLQNKS